MNESSVKKSKKIKKIWWRFYKHVIVRVNLINKVFNLVDLNLVIAKYVVTRDVKVSRPAWSRDQRGMLRSRDQRGLETTFWSRSRSHSNNLGLGLGLMRYWSRVPYVLVSWCQRDHLLT